MITAYEQLENIDTKYSFSIFFFFFVMLFHKIPMNKKYKNKSDTTFLTVHFINL